MSLTDPDDRDPPSPPPGAFVRGVAVGIVCDAMISAPIAMLLPLVRPENVADAIGKLLFGLNLLVGYAGGRVAGRAGIAHDDSRSQWSMASVVSAASIATEVLLYRLRLALHLVRLPTGTAAASTERLSPWPLIMFVAMVLLIRFGYAMGTYAHAKRAGQVHDEDEASAE